MQMSDTDPSDRPKGSDEVYCRNCGSIIAEAAEICPECGVRQRPPPRSTADDALQDLIDGGNPVVAAILSAILPGLGQIYNRELERGLVFIAASVLSAFSSLALIGFVLFPLVWLFAIYDAYTRADRGNEPGSTSGEYERRDSRTRLQSSCRRDDDAGD